MLASMLSGIITSKLHIRILMRLFINPKKKAYLRELTVDFEVSPSHIKTELDQLKAAGLLTSYKNGRQVLFAANTGHPIFNELQSMVQKTLGMDQIIESIITRIGNLEMAFLIGDYAEGKDTGIIDLALVGNINQNQLNDLTKKTERYIKRKIRTLVLDNNEFKALKTNLEGRSMMLLWDNETDR